MKINLNLIIIIIVLIIVQLVNNGLAINYKNNRYSYKYSNNKDNSNNNNRFKYFHYPHYNQYFSFSPTSSTNNLQVLNSSSNSSSFLNNNSTISNNSNENCKVLFENTITIFDDYLNSQYISNNKYNINQKYFESFSVKNQIPTFSNSRFSIKINNTFNNNDQIEFISKSIFFNSKTVSELNFKVYLPNRITNKIKIQLISNNDINVYYGEKIPILYTISQFNGNPPYQQWLNARIPIKSNDQNTYNGFRIITDIIKSENDWIDELYLDDFKLLVNQNQIIDNSSSSNSDNKDQSFNINTNNHNRKILEFNDNSNNNNDNYNNNHNYNSKIINKYFLKSSKIDILLSNNNNNNNDYSIFTNYLNNNNNNNNNNHHQQHHNSNLNNWKFESGTLEEYSNGILVLSGSISDKNLCKWNINLEFLEIKIKSINSLSRKELLSSYYIENGGPIDSSKWKFYEPLIDEHSFWNISRSECYDGGKVNSYKFTNLQSNLPMQIGYGANCRNSNYGLSVILVLNYEILIELNLDLNNYQQIDSNNNNQISNEINYNSCEFLKCPNGFKCILNKDNGERECKLKAYEHYNEEEEEENHYSDNSCLTLKCPFGYSCNINNGIKTCIKDHENNNSYKWDCTSLECPNGFSCWYNSTDETLSCKKINEKEDDPCYNFECPRNHHCVYEQSQRKCAPIISRKHATCNNVKCPNNYECRIQSNSLPRCYPIIDPCKFKVCKHWEQECRVTECGEAKCFYPEECCEGKYCPPGYKCVKYNGIDECVGLPPPVKVKTCDDISCPINFTCIDINRGSPNGNFTPFCIPNHGSCEAYTTTYDLEGKIWIDSNGDGKKNRNENQFKSNIFVRLLNNLDNTPATNSFGNIIPISISDNNGHFIFNDVKPGSYVLFFGLVNDYHWTKLENSWVNSDGFSVAFDLPNYQPNDTRFLLDGTPVTNKYLSKKIIFPSPTPKDYKNLLSIHQNSQLALTPLPENLLLNPTNVCPTHFIVSNILAGLVPNSIDPPPPTPPPTPSPKPKNGLFSIGKRVFYDFNNNGVFDQSDKGVANVKIILLNKNGLTIQSSTTDSKGYYFFDLLKSGEYMVKLENIPLSFSLSSYNHYPLSKDTNTSIVFTLNKDSDSVVLTDYSGIYPRKIEAQYIRPDVDFALVSDLPLVAVGDTVYYDQNKNGKQDSNEKGINGIQVLLISEETGKTLFNTITDLDGHYLFDNVQSGSYILVFKVPNGYSTTNNFATLQSNTGEFKSKPFKLNENSPFTSTRKPFKPVTAPHFDDTKDLPLFYSNSFGIGHVTFIDSNLDGIYTYSIDKPLPGVRVSLLYSDNPKVPVTNIFGDLVGSVSSDVNGIYYFDNLKPGTYNVLFDSPKGYRLTELPRNFLVMPEMSSLAKPETSQTNPLNLEKVSKTTPVQYKARGINAAKMFIGANAGYYVPPTISIGYMVWDDANYNGVFDLNEQAVPGIMATLYDSRGNQALDVNGEKVSSVFTNSLGKYLFTKIPEGSYYISFSNLPSGYILTDQRVLYSQSSGIDSAPNPNTGFTSIFKLSTTEANVRLTLPQDNSPDFYIYDHENAGIVKGNQVKPNIYAIGRYVYFDDNRNGQIDEGENGVENIKVQIISPNGQPALDFRGKAIQPVYTDSSGKYIIDNLPEGQYQIYFSNLPNTYNFENLEYPYPNFLTGRTGIFELSPKTTVEISKLRKSRKYILLENQENSNSVDQNVKEGVNAITGLFNNIGSNSIQGLSQSTTSLNESNSIESSFSSSSTKEDEGLEEFPLNNYNPILESRVGGFPLENVQANRSDLTRNAAIVRSPSYAFGQLVFFIDEKGDTIGVPGVTVTLSDSLGNPVYNMQGKLLGPATTDSTGQYRFNLLRAGSYHVEFTNIPPGFTYYNPVTGVIDFDLVNLNKDVRGALPADKVPRAVYYNPKINLQLTQPYTFAIGNQVWNDTNKDGLYQIGEPFMSDVVVSITDSNGNQVYDHFYQLVNPTITDSNGEYFFDNLVEGSYIVKFEAPSRYYFTAQLESFDEKKNPNTFNSYPNSQGLTSVIELFPEKFLEDPPPKYKSIIKALVVNFHIDAGLVYDVHYVKSYAVGRYVFRDSNDNGIMDEGEKGVPNVKVDIYYTNGSPVKDIDGNQVKPTFTDENGLYIFDSLPSGSYVIKFSEIPNDLMFSNKTTPNPNTGITDSFLLFPALPNIRLTTPEDGVLGKAVDFNQNAGLIDAVSFSLGHYIWFDMNSNGLMDEDEPPATELTMVLYKCNLVDLQVDCNVDYQNFTFTDNQGYYYFDNLIAGIYKLYFWNAIKTYQVTIAYQGDGTNDSKAVNDIIGPIYLNIYNENVTLVDNVNLDKNVNASYIDRTLNIGLLKPSMFSVGYKVWYDTNRNGIIDAKELPVENVTVSLKHLKSKSNDYSLDIYGKPLVATTNATGHYWIDNIIPGFYIAKFTNLPNDTRFTVKVNDNAANAYGITGTISLFFNSTKVHPFNPYIDIGTQNADYVYSKANAGILKGKADVYLYAVSGYVYFDDNKNGIKDPGEATVNGTRVDLLDLSGNPVVDADSYQIPTYITGPDGFYKFDGFLKGDYQISFLGVPGVNYQFFSPLDQQHLNHSVLDNVVISVPENPKLINATSADKVNAAFYLKEQNAGIIKLITYAIGRRVIPNYYNTTLQNSGYKGGNVTVTLYRNNAIATYADGSPIYPVLTDSNGFYFFDNVPILEGYQVMFSNLPDGWMFEVFRNSLTPFIQYQTLTTFNLPRARPIPINKSEYPNLRATYGFLDQNTYISPILFGIGDSVFIDVDGSGTQAIPKLPLAGVTVTLVTSDYKPAFDAFGNRVEPIITDIDGIYKFMDLYHDKYMVHFSLVNGYSFTLPFSGDDQTLDSNVNPSDGYSNVVELDVTDPNIFMIPLETRNLTIVCDNSIDAGYVSLSPKGYISGMTYIDYNADSKFNSYDKPVANITVSIFIGDNGELVSTTKTDKNGFYSFSDLFISTQYQVVFSNIPKGYYPLGDTVQFPVASKTGVNLGIIYPKDYCQNEIKIFTTCFVKGDSNKDVPVLVSFPYGSYSDLSNDYGDKEEMLTLSDTRTIYGVGYDRKTNTLYVSPYKKQFASISPQTASSIFRKNLTTGQVSVYVNLATIFGFDFLAAQGRVVGDALTYRILFGDLDIVDDYIWVTNLYRNIVVKIPLRETPTKDNIKLINITHDCGVNGPFRIFGLGWDGNNMYVGGVCECSVSFNHSGLLGVVKKINDDETTTTDILTIPLNYPRGRLQTRIMYLSDQTPIYSSIQNATWVPWNDTNGNFKPQAQITDIVFTGNGGGGNMIVLFKDRQADSQSVTPAGDMLMACKDSNGNYQLESAGVCGGIIGANPIPIGPMIAQGPGGGEFFDDNFGNRDWQHDETSWGSAYYLPGSGEIVGGSYDLYSTNEAVVKHWSLTNGRVLGGFILIHGAGLDFVFNKVNGLGDIDTNCGLPDTFIGNYVWLDQNQNGLQDPNEKGIANVTVQLFDDSDGTFLNMTKTNDNGIYFFQVHAGFHYRIHFVLPPTYKYTISINVQEDNDPRSIEEINSQVDSKGDFYFYAEIEGQNNLDIDCGLIRG